MRIIVSAPASVVTDQDKTDLQLALDAVGKSGATFDEVRAKLSAGKRSRFTDGMIHQAALDMGLKVEVDG